VVFLVNDASCDNFFLVMIDASELIVKSERKIWRKFRGRQVLDVPGFPWTVTKKERKTSGVAEWSDCRPIDLVVLCPDG
jgi:hypothetical protein